jgi:small neutral amino acid transporter SnatA (MarC family)
LQASTGSVGHGATGLKRHKAKNFAISFTSFHVGGGVVTAVFAIHVAFFDLKTKHVNKHEDSLYLRNLRIGPALVCRI